MNLIKIVPQFSKKIIIFFKKFKFLMYDIFIHKDIKIFNKFQIDLNFLKLLLEKIFYTYYLGPCLFLILKKNISHYLKNLIFLKFIKTPIHCLKA